MEQPVKEFRPTVSDPEFRILGLVMVAVVVKTALESANGPDWRCEFELSWVARRRGFWRGLCVPLRGCGYACVRRVSACCGGLLDVSCRCVRSTNLCALGVEALCYSLLLMVVTGNSAV